MPDGATATRTDIVRGLHELPQRGVIYVTGGGSLLLSDLLRVPGASATLLEAGVPYAPASLASLLGTPPERACSAATARDLAMRAFLRATELVPGADTFGFAITASLRSTRRKQGEHRAHCAMQTAARTHTISVHLAKGRRSREQEERLLADIALAALAEAVGMQPPPVKLTAQDTFDRQVAAGDADTRALLSGARPAIGADAGAPKAILPGAFNPLHEGHRRMAATANARLREPVAYELCIRNVDKPPLNFHDMRERRQQFTPSEDIWLTNASTFVDKARVFGAVTFVVGADTMRRIADAKYYEDGDVDAAVDELARIGCRFLVFGRVLDRPSGRAPDQASGHGEPSRFVTLDDLSLPGKLRDLAQGISEAEFRSDVSSTALRARPARGDPHE